jgi:hypothetical protein
MRISTYNVNQDTGASELHWTGHAEELRLCMEHDELTEITAGIEARGFAMVGGGAAPLTRIERAADGAPDGYASERQAEG